MKKVFCPQCGHAVNTHIEEREEVFPVKGEGVTVLSKIRICGSCGTDIYDRELDGENLSNAFNVYRKKHKIVSPEEIIELRGKYGLSQRSLGSLLDWGEITIHRYENGSIPDDAHNQVLKLINDPYNMTVIYEQNKSKLSQRFQSAIEDRLRELIKEERREDIRCIGSPTFEDMPNIFNGFKSFSPDTIKEMILFFCSKKNGIIKTKLNKLLWYSDFLHYRYHSVSISGARYIHLAYGPVPDNYEVYLHNLVFNNLLEIEEKHYPKGGVGELLKCKGERLPDLLEESNLIIMDAVYRHFKNKNASETSKISHKETAYLKTKNLEHISYKYADELEVHLDS